MLVSQIEDLEGQRWQTPGWLRYESLAAFVKLLRRIGIQDNRFVKLDLDRKLGNRWRNRVTRLNAEDLACFKEGLIITTLVITLTEESGP